MLIKRIDGSTRQLGAPADWDGKDMSCGVLPILDVQTPEGNFMFSAWEPTPPELEALNKGANILLGVRGTAHPVVSLQVAADAEVKHPDDIAVDQFAEVMKAKLADARAKGRSGWQQCDPAELSYMLREHVEKGDPRDVANFCMMLWNNGVGIAAVAQPACNTCGDQGDVYVVKHDGELPSHDLAPCPDCHKAVAQPVADALRKAKWLFENILERGPTAPTEHDAKAGIAAIDAALAQPAEEVQPVGNMVLMPRRLTAENGAKGALSGEFSERFSTDCPVCDADEPDTECDICSGSGRFIAPVPVEWDTIKRIYKAAVELLGAPSPAVAVAPQSKGGLE